MKKLISVLIVAVIMVCSAAPALASDSNNCMIEKPIAGEKFQALSIVTASLRINASTATCKGVARASRNGYSIRITMRLQKKTGSTWTNVASWTGSGAGTIGAALNKTKSGLSAGTYRTSLYAAVFNNSGSYVESTTVYSKYIGI